MTLFILSLIWFLGWPLVTMAVDALYLKNGFDFEAKSLKRVKTYRNILHITIGILFVILGIIL